MSLLSRLRDYLRPTDYTGLRNRPHGLAWVRINAETHPIEAAMFNGWIVTTKKYRNGMWDIEPMPTHRSIAGNTLTITELSSAVDYFLEPLKNPGQSEDDESARWLPSVPQSGVRETA